VKNFVFSIFSLALMATAAMADSRQSSDPSSEVNVNQQTAVIVAPQVNVNVEVQAPRTPAGLTIRPTTIEVEVPTIAYEQMASVAALGSLELRTPEAGEVTWAAGFASNYDGEGAGVIGIGVGFDDNVSGYAKFAQTIGSDAISYGIGITGRF
jgi:hypothetical protein